MHSPVDRTNLKPYTEIRHFQSLSDTVIISFTITNLNSLETFLKWIDLIVTVVTSEKKYKLQQSQNLSYSITVQCKTKFLKALKVYIFVCCSFPIE